MIANWPFNWLYHWATVQAGTTLLIGLHPWSEKYPRPGTKGSGQIGLVVSRDEPIGDLAARLRKHGVEVSDIIKSEEANYGCLFHGNVVEHVGTFTLMKPVDASKASGVLMYSVVNRGNGQATASGRDTSRSSAAGRATLCRPPPIKRFK